MFDANLVIQQLAGSMGKLKMFTGAKDFSQDPEKKYVSFKIGGGAVNKCNFIKIRLNSMDTYDIEFGKIGRKANPEMKKLGIKVMVLNYQILKDVDNVYCDQLTSVFEEETGMFLSFSGVIYESN